MKIIGISGRKQAGKNTVANYINGDLLKRRGMIRDFFINENGNLIVETCSEESHEYGFGQFDVVRKDEAFITYAEKELWPYIKVYHFADPLKQMSVNLFGLNAVEVYGNDDQKNMKTDIYWQSMPNNFDNKEGRMTNREFLEHFGTNIIRKIKNDAWVSFTINSLVNENPEIAIIPDVRFPNEIEAIKKAGGINIRLTRDVYSSKSDSESALDKDKFDWNNFDIVIDNNNLSLEDLCDYLSKNSSIWR
jgi:hypothetical protein